MSRIILSWRGRTKPGAVCQPDIEGEKHEGRVLQFLMSARDSIPMVVVLDEKRKAISVRELGTVKFEREEPDAPHAA